MNTKLYFLIFIICLIFSACPAEDDNGKLVVKTGRVTFFNESSYMVIVHQDAFSGPVLVELSAGQSRQIDVRVSENHGLGTYFSIEYLYRISDAFDTDSGEVIASGIDPNVQINRNIEENKSYTIQIPQPANLEFRTAFYKILNSHNLPFELKYLNTVFKQAGNDTVSVAPSKTGVYKFDGIPTDGRLFQNYEVVSTFASTPVPNENVKNGVIYSFTYDGTLVTKTGEQTIIFK